MTEVANPEQLLFASTAQAFLEKEASLGRVRELHAEDVSFETGLVATRRRTRAGPACWYPKNSAAAASPGTVSPTSP